MRSSGQGLCPVTQATTRKCHITSERFVLKMSSGFLLCSCLFLTLNGANANAFLKARGDQSSSERISAMDVQTSLLAEVEESLGTSTGSKVSELETALQPIFKALPKNEQGGLGHTTVRYALHRAFVQRHGWFIQGLDRAGQSWNESDTNLSTGILADQVPAYVQDLFEQRLAGKGLGLHELAVLAATVEHLVHREALSKLGEAFMLHKRLPTEVLNVEDANEILETYMMQYILGEKFKVSTKVLKALKKKMPQIYVAWPETRLFIRNVRSNVTDSADNLDFAMIARVAERIGEQFGSFQNQECHQLKEALLKFEDRGSGRVRLPDFWRPAHLGESNSWQFQESIPYLRQLGAIDDSDPDDLKVIIANYLGSQANCIASSSFYGVCCMDECESLLVHLENDIKAPEATPQRILSLVGSLPSATMSAPRELSTKLRSRLFEIAENHGGAVPLHGRLFLQWMHHAYPRECLFPHTSGTTAPQAAMQFQKSGEKAVASDEEIERIMKEDAIRNSSASIDPTVTDYTEEIDLVPWSHEEELLVVRPLPQLTQSRSLTLGGIRSIIVFAAIASIAFGFVRRAKPTS